MQIAPYSSASRRSALADTFHLGGSKIKKSAGTAFVTTVLRIHHPLPYPMTEIQRDNAKESARLTILKGVFYKIGLISLYCRFMQCKLQVSRILSYQSFKINPYFRHISKKQPK